MNQIRGVCQLDAEDDMFDEEFLENPKFIKEFAPLAAFVLPALALEAFVANGRILFIF
jgi:hypothetical protein